jgi:hypothetical protein
LQKKHAVRRSLRQESAIEVGLINKYYLIVICAHQCTISDNMQSLYSPVELARRLADRVKALRLTRGWSQKETALRTGIPLATYRYFERTGLIALVRFVRLLDVLGVAEELESLGASGLRPATSIDELMKPTRQRGRTS